MATVVTHWHDCNQNNRSYRDSNLKSLTDQIFSKSTRFPQGSQFIRDANSPPQPPTPMNKWNALLYRAVFPDFRSLIVIVHVYVFVVNNLWLCESKNDNKNAFIFRLESWILECFQINIADLFFQDQYIGVGQRIQCQQPHVEIGASPCPLLLRIWHNINSLRKGVRGDWWVVTISFRSWAHMAGSRYHIVEDVERLR